MTDNANNTQLSSTITGRINAVQRAIAYVQKDATVDNKYKAVTHDNVTAMTRPFEVEQGILFIPSVIPDTVKMGEARDTRSGAKIYRCEGVFDILVVADGCKDHIEMRVLSHADDMGDKAPGKLLSYAVKYARLKLYALETGESDESRVDEQGKKVMEHLSDELNEYLEAGDSLAIYLMGKKVGDKMWVDLYNSAPAGKKVAWKAAMTDHEKTGLAVLQEINKALLSGDDLKAKENLADLTPGGRRMLSIHLGWTDSQELGKLTKK